MADKTKHSGDRDATLGINASPRPRVGLVALIAGATSATFSAFVTAVLLLLNGSFVLVFLHSIAESSPAWFRREGVLQFLLFVLPLLMVVAQWLLWDLIGNWFSKRRVHKDPWNCT